MNALRSAADRPDRKVSVTIWVTEADRSNIEFWARACGAYRAQFLRECVNAGWPLVIEKHLGKERVKLLKLSKGQS